MAKTKERGLRIAVFGQKHIPSNEGGVEVVVEQLATRMVERGHSVTCYNRNDDNVAGAQFNQENLKEYKGIQMKYVPTIRKKGWAALTSSIAASIAAAFGPYDLVHIHAEGPAFMCWLPKLMGKTVFVTIHGLDHRRAKWGKLASTCIMMGERNAVRFADEIIVLSESVQEYFMETYGRRTRFIPNGISPVTVQKDEMIREQFELEKDSYILFLGRIVPEKGIRKLIQAFRKVNTDKKLVIAGGSSDTKEFFNELRDLAKEDDRILFTDFVQGQVKEELYSNAYLYTLPSDLEGMPLALLEAMAYGNCCLTSDIPECTSVYEDCGLSFRQGDVSDLTSKLQLLCDRPALVQEYKERSADYILQKYNWETVVDQTLELYKD